MKRIIFLPRFSNRRKIIKPSFLIVCWFGILRNFLLLDHLYKICVQDKGNNRAVYSQPGFDLGIPYDSLSITRSDPYM